MRLPCTRTIFDLALIGAAIVMALQAHALATLYLLILLVLEENSTQAVSFVAALYFMSHGARLGSATELIYGTMFMVSGLLDQFAKVTAPAR